MNKTISGVINCIDKHMLEYSVHYKCTFEYSIFDYFSVKKNINTLTNIIEHNIKTEIAMSYLKVFIKDDLTQEQKEYTKWMDLVKTQKIQRLVRDLITADIISEFDTYKCNVTFFQYMPCDVCHTFSAALM